VAGWLFFRVARSLPINLDMVVAPALKNRQPLKNRQLIRRLPDDVTIVGETVHQHKLLAGASRVQAAKNLDRHSPQIST
jgi:hypothetical protein